jgi:RNA polymerase sigma factor (sigma-70 family)
VNLLAKLDEINANEWIDWPPCDASAPWINPYQRLFEQCCPGPLDRPHRARLDVLAFWVQNYWSRWAHARHCYADPRWNGKVRCEPDSKWDTTTALGLEEIRSRKLDYRMPEIFFKKPVLGFFLLWLLAALGLGPTWEDSPPEPQRKNIHEYRGGLAPFHHIARPDEVEERRLVKLAKADPIARNTLIASHLWLSEQIADEFRRYVTDDEVDDLQQEAALALFKAVDDFDPESGNRFSTFAWDSVKGDVRDWLRRMGKLKRHVSAEMIGARNDAALGLYASNSVKTGLEHKIFRQLFEKT